jgi:hypothetical protein
MRLDESRNIRQHRSRKVGALDFQVVEQLYEPISHRKICCHQRTSLMRLHRPT